MISSVKIILLTVFISFSLMSFGQSNPKKVMDAREKVEAEERARREAEENQKNASDVKMFKVKMANPQAQTFYSFAMSQINAKHISWINETSDMLVNGTLKESSIRQYTNNYGKEKNINNQGVDGLTILVVQEAYDKMFIASDDLYDSINAKKLQKYKLQSILLKIDDSIKQFTKHELDSINLIIAEADVQSKNKSTSKIEEGEEKTINEANRQSPENNFASIADLALVKKKITNKITVLKEFEEEQSKRLAEITNNQDILQGMLYMMMKQVSDSQNSIIEHLK